MVICVPKPTRYYSNRQERQVAKSLGGKKTPNSGATPFSKGDVVAGDWLIECKTSITDKSSMAIKEAWLTKLNEEAFAMGKSNSALCFTFGPNSRSYYIISEKLFKMLKEYMEEDNGI